MNLKNSFSILLVAILLFSCDKKRVFDEYKSVGSSWHKDSIISFDLPELETNKSYNTFVNIRNNNDYPYNNLYLIVSLEYPNKKIKVDTLEYQMTNPDGSLMGEGITDIKDNKLVYKENLKFDLKGIYKIHLRHAVRETGKIQGIESLNGVSDVGFRIETID
jgi:gliding motility-associated lipoprotein GldH